MANRNWRSGGGGYQSFTQLLNPMPYYQNMNYNNDRKNYGGRVSYREDNYKRERKDFQTGRRDRISPNRRRSPYQRSHELHGDFRRDSKKSHGRYEVNAPRMTFDIKELSTSSLKLRYPKMFIPSDFFMTHLRWQEVFPLYRTMKLGNHSEFQILHKDVEFDEIHNEELMKLVEPSDADPTYSVKVMLIAMPDLVDLYKSTCSSIGTNISSGVKSLYKNIQFLLGDKGKKEPMSIGGPWSPSLDGLHPDKDSSVLVNTAIRTCKALIGIDLSHCKKWYKFLEIHYYKSIGLDGTDMSGNSEPRVETVVIFIPDIWSCMPTDKEWTEKNFKFEKKLSSLTMSEIPEEPVKEIDEVKITDEVKDEIEENQNLNQMKVAELKAELSSRGLDVKGVKAHLVKRLQEAMDKEKLKVENVEDRESNIKKLETVEILSETTIRDTPVEEIKKSEETKELSDKEIKRLEKLYKLNDKPSILVQPNKQINDGRFECYLVSLESLLDLKNDDQKEQSFELSLFAHQFSEMIQRDASFYIFQCLSELPEQVVETNEPALKKPRFVNEKSQEIDVIKKSKMIFDMNLLFSFCVIDNENSGYLRDHDLEDIIHSLGLNLSRSQVRKLISKIPNKRGNLMYRELTDKDVIEGSEEDVAVLKDKNYILDRTVELSKGNKAFFEESDVQDMVVREESLGLLDKLSAVEFKKADYKSQVTLIHNELEKIKSIQNDSGDVESSLKESISKIQEKLQVEKDSYDKLSQVTKVYHDILKSTTEYMGVSIHNINDQFEQERKLVEELKAKEEEKMESNYAVSKEQEFINDDKRWQVVDQV